jgi:hypothetical protein
MGPRNQLSKFLLNQESSLRNDVLKIKHRMMDNVQNCESCKYKVGALPSRYHSRLKLESRVFSS